MPGSIHVPNKVRIDGDMAIVEMTRRDGSMMQTIISASDVERVLSVGRRWYPLWNQKVMEFRAAAPLVVNGQEKIVLLHRFLMDAKPGEQVDHINQDGLDNRRENLRIVSHSQNNQNQASARRHSKTGVRGVVRDKRTGRYRSEIAVDKKRFHLGVFDTIEEAAAAYTAARVRLHTHCPENSGRGGL